MEKCDLCNSKKYIFMSPDGSPLGSPGSTVAPCLQCSSGKSLKDIELEGGFILTKGTNGWVELNYKKFEETFISLIQSKKRFTQAQAAGFYAMKIRYFSEFPAEIINKTMIGKWGHAGLDKVKGMAWGFDEGIREFNKVVSRPV